MKLYSAFTITSISINTSNREINVIHQSVQLCDDDKLLTTNLDDEVTNLTKSLS